MEKIDVFAHVLLPNFYHKMLEINPHLPEEIPFIHNEVLTDLNRRRETSIQGVKQIISYVNVNPEDYTDADTSYLLCKEANNELIETIKANKKIYFMAG